METSIPIKTNFQPSSRACMASSMVLTNSPATFPASSAAARMMVRYDEDKEALTGIGDEPWHFRYVGIPHAAVMAEEDLCLEEYIDYLKQFPYDGQHLTAEYGGEAYEIWYCAGTQAWLPDTGEYTVSGNNVDGVIVTYKIGS